MATLLIPGLLRRENQEVGVEIQHVGFMWVIQTRPAGDIH